eukprot:TRINITY_DN6763_c0_g3_i2.p1 TRINITY_DN6763_c0_g3~~TRINITY_DN6763_c0_g3_i2.p1  ORF type:complete len:640 (+),score=184.52 TRINITY_DN6763_c0_g3_i2:68-1987(+)
MSGAPARGKSKRGGGAKSGADTGLLGFTVGSQGHYHTQTYEHQSRAIAEEERGGRGGYRASKPASGSKDGFVLSNFRLGVYERDTDLAKYLSCTDGVLPWNRVEQVVTWGSFDDHRCPICLEPPRAGRITACGHIFCHPCLVSLNQRFAEEGKKLKCPLCHKVVDLDAVKMVSMLPTKTHKAGETVSFTLVRRERNSVLGYVPGDVLRVKQPPSVLSESARFGRYFALSKADLLDMLSADVAQLTMCLEQALDEGDEGETLLLQESLQAVSLQCEEVNANYTSSELTRTTSAQDAVDDPAKLEVYYQSEDGQFLTLSPLHQAMITHDAGEKVGVSPEEVPWSFLPPQLELNLTDVEVYTQSDKTVRRFPCFAHLPHGAQLSVGSPELEGVVGAATLQAFAAQTAAMKKKKAEEKQKEDAEQRRLSKRREAARKKEEEEERARLESEGYRFDPVLPDVKPDYDDITAFPTLGGGESGPRAAPAGWTSPPLRATLPEDPQVSVPPPTLIERRIHPKTGVAYRQEEFIKQYEDPEEGATLWATAIETTPVVETMSIGEIQALERQGGAAKPAAKKGGAWGLGARPVPPATIRAVATSSVSKAPEPEKPTFDFMDAALHQPTQGKKKKNKGVKISLNTGAVSR